METGSLIHTLLGHKDGLTCCVANSNGSVIFTGSSDTNLISWDVQTGLDVNIFKGKI